MTQPLNSSLHSAKANPNDEFYTQISDIEKELLNYREHFKGKTVFMNCDDPKESNFWLYFYLNFDYLGLKKIISTHFDYEKPTYKLEYYAEKNGQMTFKQTPLEQNGDFRSPEAIELLKEADIVVTNPPFSLFREYVAQLMKYKKEFLIIGNMNAITYSEIFPLLKDNKMWLGIRSVKEFAIPKNAPVKSGQRIDDKGQRYQKFGNVGWYTNLEHSKRNEELILWKRYTPEEFPTYDNFEAIEVSKVKQIPIDYDGVMGVPITFMSKYNPNQFKILALSRYMKTDGMSKEFVDRYYASGQTGQISEGHPDLCYYDKNGRPTVPYMRILIQKIDKEESK